MNVVLCLGSASRGGVVDELAINAETVFLSIAEVVNQWATETNGGIGCDGLDCDLSCSVGLI